MQLLAVITFNRVAVPFFWYLHWLWSWLVDWFVAKTESSKQRHKRWGCSAWHASLGTRGELENCQLFRCLSFEPYLILRLGVSRTGSILIIQRPKQCIGWESNSWLLDYEAHFKLKMSKRLFKRKLTKLRNFYYAFFRLWRTKQRHRLTIACGKRGIYPQRSVSSQTYLRCLMLSCVRTRSFVEVMQRDISHQCCAVVWDDLREAGTFTIHFDCDLDVCIFTNLSCVVCSHVLVLPPRKGGGWAKSRFAKFFWNPQTLDEKLLGSLKMTRIVKLWSICHAPLLHTGWWIDDLLDWDVLQRSLWI